MSLPTIYLAGDSTVQSYKKEAYPQMGWGQLLHEFFSCIIKNHAMAARSTKTFLEEGRLDVIHKELQAGDYLFLQFAHNDANENKPERYVSLEDFPSYLMHYVRCAREKKAHCVFVTPIAQRIRATSGCFGPSFLAYRQTMIDLAKKENLPLIDLGLLSSTYLNTLSEEETKKLYMPEDDSHLQEYGARIYASLLAREVLKLNLDISAYCSLRTL